MPSAEMTVHIRRPATQKHVTTATEAACQVKREYGLGMVPVVDRKTRFSVLFDFVLWVSNRTRVENKNLASVYLARFCAFFLIAFGGEWGIRTPGTVIPYVSLANWWFQPLTQLSGLLKHITCY